MEAVRDNHEIAAGLPRDVLAGNDHGMKLPGTSTTGEHLVALTHRADSPVCCTIYIKQEQELSKV